MTNQITKKDVRERIDSLKIWHRNSEQAPHKPLLILLAIAKAAQGHERMCRFASYEPQLRELLQKYCEPRQSHHPAYPFWRLQNDGIWEIETDGNLQQRASNTDPSVSELREQNVRGGFPEEIYNLFRENPAFCDDVAASILVRHFDSFLHDKIREDVGLPLCSR